MAATLPPEGPNEAMIRSWNEQGAGWVAAREGLDRQIGPLGRIGIEHAAPVPGEHVLDVGCGCGDTSLELARAVAPGGRVVGIDISTPMLEEARTRARDEGLENLELLNADAQTHAFPAEGLDLAFSRFGVMFFADPEAAFGNLWSALRPGGRLTFVCWQALELNPWLHVPLRTVAEHVPMPAPGDPHEPGPFAFADDTRVTAILERAGFESPTALGVADRIRIGGGGSLERAAQSMMQMGPAAATLRRAGVDDPAELEKIEAAMVRNLAPYMTPEGVAMDCAIWILRARRPL